MLAQSESVDQVMESNENPAPQLKIYFQKHLDY